MTTPSSNSVAADAAQRAARIAALLHAATELAADLQPLRFAPPVACVYQPLEYAWDPFERYVRTYGGTSREVLLLGMNPGPFGMGQTGVPFGEISMARTWLRIEAPVGRPASEHPKRPIQGFACTRSEVSGRRLWSWAQARFGAAEGFFGRFFVANYCPLLFMEQSGRNRTPDQLPATERDPLYAACDKALLATAQALEVRAVVGIGRFAEQRARAALEPLGIRVIGAPHPSPANPAANQGWSLLMDEVLRREGLLT